MGKHRAPLCTHVSTAPAPQRLHEEEQISRPLTAIFTARFGPLPVGAPLRPQPVSVDPDNSCHLPHLDSQRGCQFCTRANGKPMHFGASRQEPRRVIEQATGLRFPKLVPVDTYPNS
jgi:hypothetical protein